MKIIKMIIMTISIVAASLICPQYYFLIPIIFYYCSSKVNNLIIILVPFIISIIIFRSMFQINNYITYILLIVAAYNCIYHLIINKKSQIIQIISKIVILICSLFLISFKQNNINIIYIVYIILMISIYILFLYLETKGKELYNDYIISLILIYLSFNSSRYVVIIITVLFIIHFINEINISNYIIYNMSVFFLLSYYRLELAILILLLGFVYYLKNIYSFFIYNMIIIILILCKTSYNTSELYLLLIINIITKIIYTFFNKYKYIDITNNCIFDNNILENEYQAFMLTLNNYLEEFNNPNLKEKEFFQAYEVIMNRHCKQCAKMQKCFKQNMLYLTKEFNNLIINDKCSKEFSIYCTSFQNMRDTINNVKKQMRHVNDEQIPEIIVFKTATNILNDYFNDIKKLKKISFSCLELLINKFKELLNIVPILKINKAYEQDYDIELLIDKNIQENVIKKIKTNLITKIIPNSQVQCLPTDEHLKLKIVPQNIYNISYSFGSLAKDELHFSGDSHILKKYQTNHFIAAISDGMGKGYEAYLDSQKVLKILDDLLSTSLLISTKINILNLLYKMQSYTERYATLDIIDINLVSAYASIYKLGASSTYIIHYDNTYFKVENTSLPLGVENNIYETTLKLSIGDLIVMSSDGVFGNLIEEEKLIDYIISIKDKDVEEISYEAMEFVLKQKKLSLDDITLIILKLE